MEHKLSRKMEIALLRVRDKKHLNWTHKNTINSLVNRGLIRYISYNTIPPFGSYYLTDEGRKYFGEYDEEEE